MQTVSSFRRWIKEKISLHFREKTPDFNVGEIRWCSIGENIGVEINGKGKSFSRPVYILKKTTRNSAIVIPLTSKRKHGSWFAPITANGINGSLVLNQTRLISANRLFKRISSLSKDEQNRIQNAYQEFIKS